MATRSIQLQASFGASFASTSASQIYYSVESFDGTSRIARTNSTVRAAGDGSFFALPSIDDAWLPCIAKWDDGGSSGLGSATRKASGGIDSADAPADSPVGPGSSPNTVRVLVDGTPVADADVWLTTDADGEDVYAGTLQTQSNGTATFMCDADNVYYLWAQKDGINAIQGEEFTAV